MAITAIGFDGTIDESSFSRLMNLGGMRDVVLSRGDMQATPVANTRAVRFSVGKAYSAGLLVESTDTPTVTLPPASGGQWHLLVLRRNWDTNAITFISIPHTTTTAQLPIAPPVGFPAAMQRNPGVIYDQPLYWAWVVTGQTAVQLIDLRNLPDRDLRGTTAERTAYYGGYPSFPAARRYLQGARWYNTDSALNEVFMAQFVAGQNPGGVPNPGWYGVGVNGQTELGRSQSFNSQALDGGDTVEVDQLVIDFQTGRLVTVRHFVRWVAPGNSTGQFFGTFDERYVGPNTVKLGRQYMHAEGGGVRYGPHYIEYSMWVTPGEHVFRSFILSDRASDKNWKKDAQIVVTGAAY